MKEKFKNIERGGRNAVAFLFCQGKISFLCRQRVGDGEDSCESFIVETFGCLRRCRASASQLLAHLMPQISVLRSSLHLGNTSKEKVLEGEKQQKKCI